MMEQYILYAEVQRILQDQGICVYRSYVGNYFTSLEMMGVTVSLMRLDSELKQLLDLEVDTPALKQFGK